MILLDAAPERHAGGSSANREARVIIVLALLGLAWMVWTWGKGEGGVVGRACSRASVAFALFVLALAAARALGKRSPEYRVAEAESEAAAAAVAEAVSASGDSIFAAIEAAADSAWRAVLTKVDSATWAVLLSDVQRLYEESWSDDPFGRSLEAQAVWDAAAEAADSISLDRWAEANTLHAGILMSYTRILLSHPAPTIDSAAAPGKERARTVLAAFIRPVLQGSVLLAVALVWMTWVDWQATRKKRVAGSPTGREREGSC